MRSSKFATLALISLGLCFSVSSCFLTSGGKRRTQRGQDNAELDEIAISRKLDLKDVDHALKKMLEDLETSPLVKMVRATGERPGLAIMTIRNETDQFGLDTTNLRETFQERLLNLGCFKVVAASQMDKLKSQLAAQQTDWFDGATVPNAGNLYGFRYIIGGILKGDTERGQGEARTQYRLYLKAIDLETGAFEWIKSADITKYQG